MQLPAPHVSSEHVEAFLAVELDLVFRAANSSFIACSFVASKASNKFSRCFVLKKSAFNNTSAPMRHQRRSQPLKDLWGNTRTCIFLLPIWLAVTVLLWRNPNDLSLSNDWSLPMCIFLWHIQAIYSKSFAILTTMSRGTLEMMTVISTSASMMMTMA